MCYNSAIINHTEIAVTKQNYTKKYRTNTVNETFNTKIIHLETTQYLKKTTPENAKTNNPLTASFLHSPWIHLSYFTEEIFFFDFQY